MEALGPASPVRGADDKLGKGEVMALEARMEALEARMEALENFIEPSTVHAGHRGALSLKQHLADTPELGEFRSLAAEMREQQAELTVGRGVRMEEEERSHEALADFQDLRFEVKRLGRELQELEAHAREARRGQEELSVAVKALASGAGPAMAFAPEPRLTKLEQRLTPAEPASAANTMPTVQPQLREQEQGLKEAEGLSTAASFMPSLELRLQELEQGLAETKELCSAASSVPALEARLQEMEQGLTECKERPSITISRPPVEPQEGELPHVLTQDSIVSSSAASLWSAREVPSRGRASSCASSTSRARSVSDLEAMEHSSIASSQPACPVQPGDLRREASSVSALEERLSELEEGLLEARANAASAFPALEDRLLELERDLYEATRLSSGTGSVRDLEKRLLELEQIRFSAKDFSIAMKKVPTLEARLSDLVLDLPEANVLSSVIKAVPALEARLRKLEDGP